MAAKCMQLLDMETLCDHRGLCRNITLFFFESQTIGLCISSSSDLIQEFVELDFDDYYRYLPTCIIPDSELQYAGGFSCKKLSDDKSRKLIFTIKGYDLLNSGVWNTTLTVKIVGNCSLTSHDLGIAPWQASLNWLAVTSAIVVINVILQVTILARKSIRSRKKCKKQYRTDTVLLDSTCTGSRSNVTESSTSAISNSASRNTNSQLHHDHQEAVIVAEINPWLNVDSAHCDLQQANSISNMAAPDTVSVGTDTPEANTDSDFSVPDSISTESDPQQPTAIISNSTFSSDTVSTGSRPYPQQVNGNSSISLSETICTDCEPQQANTLPNTYSSTSVYS